MRSASEPRLIFLPALVVELVRAFAQKKAVRRHLDIEAAAAEFAREIRVVLGRVVAEQAKLESALAHRRAVAGAGIAAGLGEHRQDARGKIKTFRGARRGRR